jgi:hypothetical protein
MAGQQKDPSARSLPMNALPSTTSVAPGRIQQHRLRVQRHSSRLRMALALSRPHERLAGGVATRLPIW